MSNVLVSEKTKAMDLVIAHHLIKQISNEYCEIDPQSYKSENHYLKVSKHLQNLNNFIRRPHIKQMITFAYKVINKDETRKRHNEYTTVFDSAPECVLYILKKHKYN